MRRRLPHPRHHRREGRRGGLARRPRRGRRARTSRRRTSRSPPPASSCPPSVPPESIAASDWTVHPEDPHWPLVWLTVLTQVAVGVSATVADAGDRLLAAGLAVAALAGSLAHLGRPGLAWKALRNLRRSWLSREVALFGLYGALAALAVVAARRSPRSPRSSARPACTRRPASTSSRADRPGTRRSPSPLFGATGLAVGPLLTGRPGLAAAGVGARPRRVRRQPRSGSRGARRPDAPRAPSSSRSTGSAWSTVAPRGARRSAASSPRCSARPSLARRRARWRRRGDRPVALLRHRRARATCPARSGAARARDAMSVLDARPAAARPRPRRRPLHLRARRAARSRARSRAAPTGGCAPPAATARWAAGCCSACATARSVSVAGDPDHPVNQGRLCPKGLSEHHTITAPGRLTTPIGGRAARPRWDAALDRMVGTFRSLIDEHGPGVGGGAVHRPARHRGVLRPRQAGAARAWGSTTSTATPRSAWPARCPATSSASAADGPPGCYEDLEQADVIVLWGANIADNHPLLVPRVLANEGAAGDRGGPAGHQDRADRRRPPRRAAPHRRHAPQRHPPGAARRGPARPRRAPDRTSRASTSCSTTCERSTSTPPPPSAASRSSEIRRTALDHRRAPSAASWPGRWA